MTEDLIASYSELGYWGPEPLHVTIDEIASRRPDAAAVADQHERLSYGELVRRSHALADHLLGLGLEPGDAVALQTPNRVAIPLMHLACNRADLLFVPLSNAWRHREMAHLLKVAKAKVVIVPQVTGGFDHVAMVEELRGDLPDLRFVGSLDGLADGADFDFDDVSRRGVAAVRRERDANAARYVMVTSGTTGLPRLSAWSDNNLRHFMACFANRTDLTEDDIAVGLCPANTGATGYVFAVLGPLLVGASSVLLEHWNPVEGLRLIEAEKATTATAVPTQVVKLLQQDNLDGYDFSPLRVFTNAGAAIPPAAAEQLEKVFGCAGHVCYGSSDGGVPTMTSIHDSPEKRWTSVGRDLPGNERRLVDAVGREVAPGESGEVCWRGATKSYGYLNESEMTDAAFDEDGFYHSGDLGTYDSDGYLHITGRSKDLIIRGGQNISPVEIENLLAEHPWVSEVSVIGLPDPVYGERVCVCLVARPGLTVTLEGLSDFLIGRGVANFKLPERVEVFSELPKSAGGKISKVELRAAMAQRSAAAGG
jgi:non-ribosomal peptide synthetase component E (peptide arylation enzyme)